MMAMLLASAAIRAAPPDALVPRCPKGEGAWAEASVRSRSIEPRRLSMQIRPAIESDIPEIQAIYAHHVLHGTGTFDEEPPSVEEMAEKFHKVVSDRGVWLVAADASGVLGYAYYTQYRDRSAYRYCVEDSIYVREDVRGQGVGKALVARLIEDATARGMRQMIAVIGDSENVGSIGVHASLGFQRVGTLKSVGVKFGRWIDVVPMQRALGRGDANVPG